MALPAQLLDPGLLAIIAFNGWVATVFGFGMWAVLLGCHPAGVVVPFALLVPVVGIAAGVLILGEPLTAIELAGSAVVMARLLLNSLGPRFLVRLRTRPAE